MTHPKIMENVTNKQIHFSNNSIDTLDIFRYPYFWIMFGFGSSSSNIGNHIPFRYLCWIGFGTLNFRSRSFSQA